MSSHFFMTLDDDSLLEIIKFLDVGDILRLRRTCKRLSFLTRTRTIWNFARKSLAKELPVPYLYGRSTLDLSSGELEALVIQMVRLDDNWRSSSPIPSLVRSLDRLGDSLQPEVFMTMSFLPGGRFILAATKDGTVGLWDLEDNDGIGRSYCITRSDSTNKILITFAGQFGAVGSTDIIVRALYHFLDNEDLSMVLIWKFSLVDLQLDSSLLPFSVLRFDRVVERLSSQGGLLACATSARVQVIDLVFTGTRHPRSVYQGIFNLLPAFLGPNGVADIQLLHRCILVAADICLALYQLPMLYLTDDLNSEVPQESGGQCIWAFPMDPVSYGLYRRTCLNDGFNIFCDNFGNDISSSWRPFQPIYVLTELACLILTFSPPSLYSAIASSGKGHGIPTPTEVRGLRLLEHAAKICIGSYGLRVVWFQNQAAELEDAGLSEVEDDDDEDDDGVLLISPVVRLGSGVDSLSVRGSREVGRFAMRSTSSDSRVRASAMDAASGRICYLNESWELVVYDFGP